MSELARKKEKLLELISVVEDVISEIKETIKSEQPDNGRKGYSVSEFARMFGLNQFTVWRNIRKGKIQAIKFNNKYIIPKSEVEKLIRVKNKTL